jgi:uncharacterized protein YjcR
MKQYRFMYLTQRRYIMSRKTYPKGVMTEVITSALAHPDKVKDIADKHGIQTPQVHAWVGRHLLESKNPTKLVRAYRKASKTGTAAAAKVVNVPIPASLIADFLKMQKAA